MYGDWVLIIGVLMFKLFTVLRCAVFLLIVQLVAPIPLFAQQAELQQDLTDSNAELTALINAIVQAKNNDAYSYMAKLEAQLNEENTPEELSKLYKELIFTSLDMSDSDRQIKYSQLGMPLSFELDDIELRVYSQVSHANAISLEGNYIQARQEFSRAKKLAEIRGSDTLVFFVTAIESMLGPETGNYLEGLAKMMQYAVMLPDNRAGNKLRILSYGTLAYNHAGANDLAGMIKYYGLVISVVTKYNFSIDRETILYNFALTLTKIRDFEAAEKTFTALQKVMAQNTNSTNEFFVEYGLANLASERGQYAVSNTHALKAIQELNGPISFVANLNGLLALNYAKLNSPEKAKEYLENEANYFARHPDIQSLNFDHRKLLTEAYILMAEGNPIEGFKLLDKARLMQVDSQFNQFRVSLADIQSSLQTIVAKQEVESKLEQVESAKNQLTIIASVMGTIALLALFIMQRKHTKQLRRSISEAKKANQAKSEFLANMSHELRTPLNAILGFSEMMIHAIFGKLGAKQYHEYVKHIHDSGSHLLDIINDILDLSKIESGKLQLEEEAIDLDDVFLDVRTVLKPRTAEENLSVTSTVDKNVPYLRADRRLLKQILINLLSNGVKFTPSYGNVRLISHLNDAGAIQIEVTDTGIGMTPKELEIALTPFGQAGKTTTRSHEGTGLGLPLVKELIELHGGTMKINTRKHIGTSVIITFPKTRLGADRIEKI